MRAAWEWRGFARALNAGALESVTADLAGRLNVARPTRALDEDDLYLARPGLRHNLKLRAGQLEVKRRLDEAGGAVSLWADKELWSFPLAAEASRALRSWLPPRTPANEEDIASEAALLDRVQTCEQARAVRVRKRRLRLDLGAARLEIADVAIPGRPLLRSFCVDGYELEAVRDVVARSALEGHAAALGYPELIQALVLLDGDGEAA